MKSPFPGMDPYIESSGLWEDFHHGLIQEIATSLASSVSDRYHIRTANRSYVVFEYGEGRGDFPCVPDARVSTAAESATESDAVTLRAFIDHEFRETFIEIFEAGPEQRLVTCIEVLSASNKRRGSTGWEQYLRKRQALLLGEANLVEIDLLRGGTRMPMLDPWPASPYTLLVSRRKRGPYCKVWPVHYRRSLPPIPVPLASPDPDASLDLQPLIETVYARSRYARSIDYAKPLDPPLPEPDATWLVEQLPQRG